MNFSLQSPPASPPPAAATQELPELRRPSRPKASGGKAFLIFVVIVVAVVGVAVTSNPTLSRTITGLFRESGTKIVTYEVREANLPIVVTEKGNLESANNKDVFSQVEGNTTIIMIVPEGTPVTKGQLVCELDSAALKDTHTNQVIATEGAKASYQNAKLTREVAEIAVKEYVEGTYQQESQTVKGEIALAEAERKRALDRLDWSKRMKDKGYNSEAQYIADKVTLQQKVFAHEQSQTKKDVLERFTREKTIKELESDVKKALSDELAKKQVWDLEMKKQEKLERQIKNCNLVAPIDGLVVYANDPNRFGSSQTQIEEGASVHERQKIFSLPDISQMRVNTKVHESMVDRLRKGLRARIRVDAFANQVLTGNVEEVQPLPDPSSFLSSDIKVYTTRVSIDKGLSGLRPGMSAQVEILVANIPNVLTVPVQAVLEYKSKDHVAVQTKDGYEWRDVVLGSTNDRHIEIREGLKAGERVVLNPVSLMSEEEKREAFSGASKDAQKKDWGSAKVQLNPTAPGAPGAGAAKGGADGKAKGKRGGGNPAMKKFFEKIGMENMQKMRGASPEEQAEILKGAGLSEAEIQQFQQMREQMRQGGGFGGGRGGPGGGSGGFGGGGGGFGGGQRGDRGGPDQ